MKKVICFFIIVSLLVGAISPVEGAYVDRGDINFDGLVDVRDAVLVQKHILGISELSTDEFTRGDTNLDGVIDIKDLVFIIRVFILQIEDPEFRDPTPSA